MSVHDDLLELCTEMQRAGMKLTYDSVRERRGGGSRRDISKALREWQRRRIDEAAKAALRIPHNAAGAGGSAAQLWTVFIDQLTEALDDLKVEAAVLVHDADQEVEQLHQIIGGQLDEIDRLKLEIENIKEMAGPS